MLRILSKLRRKPDRTYSVKAIYHVDTAEMDAALAKAEELNSAIKLYYPAFSAPDIADWENKRGYPHFSHNTDDVKPFFFPSKSMNSFPEYLRIPSSPSSREPNTSLLT